MSKPTLLATVDLTQIEAHPLNVRRDLGDLDELAKSILEDGLVEAPVLVPDDSGLRIIAGHRRVAAARKAGLTQVQCIIRHDLDGDAGAHVVKMLNENTLRENLTAAEVAKGYEQLELLGMSVAESARRTGRSVPHVKGQLALAKLPEAAHQHADAGQLTLEDAVALDELVRHDPKAAARVLDKVNSYWDARHLLAEEMRKREQRANVNERIEAIKAAGGTVIKKPKDWPFGCREVSVSRLVDAAGGGLDPDEVVTQPGFAAFVSNSQGYRTLEVVCLDPDASGYEVVGYRGYVSPDEQEAKKRAEEEKKQQIEALDVAAGVRRQHLLDTFGGAKAIRSLAEGALREAATDPRCLVVNNEPANDELLRSLAGGDPEQLPDTAGPERVHRVIAARWLVHQEGAVRRAINPWVDNFHAVAARYLEWLVATTSYGLSWSETALLQELHAKLAPAEEGLDQVD